MRHHVHYLSLIAIILVLAALPVRGGPNVNVNQDTFVISNEAPGFLITRLINAGHGGDSVYQATVFLAWMPGAGAVLTPDFLNALANCPSTSLIFTTTLTQVPLQGISVSISTDGTTRYDDIEGIPYAGTFPVIQTGNGAVQNVRIIHSTDSAAPLNTTVVQGPLAGMTTSYKAFAVAWAPADSSVPTLSQWGMFLLAGLLAGAAALALDRATRRHGAVLPLVLIVLAALPVWGQGVNTSSDTFILSNEGGGLITQLVNAGYGTLNVYQALNQIVEDTNPTTAGILTPAYLAALHAAPASSQLFTTQLSSLNVPGASYAISDNGTVRSVSISGLTYYQAGYPTLAAAISGVGRGMFTHSSDSSLPVTSYAITNGLVTTTYNVFGIGWMPGQATVPALSPIAAMLLAAGLCAAAVFLIRKRTDRFDTRS